MEEKQQEQIVIDESRITKNLIDVHQEGNYIVGTTEFGTRFRQRIPQGKILNKVEGEFVLQDMVIT